MLFLWLYYFLWKKRECVAQRRFLIFYSTIHGDRIIKKITVIIGVDVQQQRLNNDAHRFHVLFTADTKSRCEKPVATAMRPIYSTCM
jgi:hypothetical protein